MRRVALRGLAGRRLRTLLTALAIVLGVALVSGTLVLTDTVDRAFDRIFSGAYDETDAVVTGRKLVDWSQSGKTIVSPDLLERIRALPEVDEAAGTILDFSGDTNQASVIDKQGEVIKGSNPTFGLGVDPRDEKFNPFELVEGSWASGGDEVVLDRSTASKHDFELGDRVAIAGDGPVRRYELVGIARLGDLSSTGGATIALFDVPTAQQVVGKHGYDAIAIDASDGVSQTRLFDAVEQVLPANTQVLSGEEQAKQDKEGVDEFITFIRWFLLAFGGIALFVGAFVIFNTLSITVAQRTRELATLRTIGASRRQVLGSVILEGLTLGAVASAVGLALGVALAKGLASLFAALDLDLPRTGLVFEPRTAIVAVVAGTLVTLAASVVPAVRATRIAPIAAVREGATTGKRPTRRGLVAGVVLLGLSGAALVFAMLGDGVSSSGRIFGIVLGALGLFLGIALVASRLVRPIASVVGWPAERIGGVAGRLARENSMRNPARTAATAAALMIGLALVTFVAVLARGLVSSDEQALRDQLAANVVVTSQSGWDTVPAGAGETIAAAPGVTVASSVRGDRALALGREVDVSGVDPETIASVYRFAWEQGSPAALASLGRDGAVVRDDFAEDEAIGVGDRIAITTPAGDRLSVVVRGVYEAPRVDALLGHVVLPQAAFDQAFERPADLYTFATASSTDAVEHALAAWPDAKVQTDAEFIDNRSAWLSSVLNIVYVLLALSVLVSLFGMVNTQVLAVFERTRELGMLRAVGMTRRQARRMIRHESVITALIGAALGMPLGVGLAALVTTSLSEYGVTFSLPVGTLVAFAVVAVVAGIVAAVAPARRASRLNVLHALQYE
jgi:putative ABC transport system permease protein